MGYDRYAQERNRWRGMAVATLLLGICFSGTEVWASTYYVDPNTGSDSNPGSAALPKLTISAGIALMAPGDTLILNDGVYQGDNLNGGTASNMIGVNGYHGRKFPPSGNDIDHLTTIRAAHVGQAIIDGQYTSGPFHSDNALTLPQYIHIDGIHFRHGAGSNDPSGLGVFGFKGNYSKITNCGFEDGGPIAPIDPTTPSDPVNQWPIAFIVGGSDHILVEDCWAWGKGRYGIYFSGSSPGTTNSIIRRCVVRQDSSDDGPTGGIMFYNSRGNAVQNSVVADSLVAYTAGIDTYGAFSLTANDGKGGNNNLLTGSIALNNIHFAGFYPQQTLAGDSIVLTHDVFWGNGTSPYPTGSSHGVLVSGTDKGTFSVSHVVSGAHGGSGFKGYAGIYALPLLNLTDSIAVGNGSYGLQTVNSAAYVDTSANIAGASTGTSVTSPFTVDPLTSGLKYLTRIEPGSGLSGQASDGGDLGATILYRIGTTDSLYGDLGWNTVTATPLWPLPNEALWVAKIKAYSATGPGGNRGFAAVNSANPLTDYVWGYLGNTVPPFNLTVTPGSGSVTLGWDGATANANLTGYKVYVGTASGNYNFAGYQGGKALGNVTTTTVAGLTLGATYFFAVTAVDSVTGESGYSYEVSTDMVPPVVSSFTVPAVSGSLTVAPVSITATDNVGVTGYLITESATPPAAGSASWSATAPVSYLAAAEGNHTLYAWAKDAAGNVSGIVSGSVNVDLTPPDVTSFSAPAISASRSIAVTLSAADGGTTGSGVAQYCLTTAPSSAGCVWSGTVPTSYDVSADGSYTIYPWAKDQAGNVSPSYGSPASVVVDTVAPVTTAFTAPAASTALSFPVTLAASDTGGSGVGAYCITTVASAAGCLWSGTVPTAFTVPADGTYTLYPWSRDQAGNVSASYATPLTIQVDSTPPVVTAFSLPKVAADSLTVPLVFTATDNVTVAGYYLSESGATPAVDAAGWTPAAPANFAFGAAGVKTVYGWVKDGLGNVSARAEATVAFAGPSNADGVVSVLDAQKALYYYLHILTPTPEERRRCDVAPVDTTTGQPVPDGNVGIDDVYVMLRKAVGLTWLPQ